MSRWPDRDSAEYAVAHRYAIGHGGRFRCPADNVVYVSWEGLKRHMSKMHYPCRFCVRAYIRVDQHERRSHTVEWAKAAGACS